jgi:hypothetical protein
MAARLTVLTAYFNPARYHSRRRNYLTFADHVRASPGARLLTVECAFGGEPFELDADDGMLQVRAEHPLWIKENLLNLGLARVDTPYVAWIDGDVLFQRADWVEQTIAALGTWRVIQPWSRVYMLDAVGGSMDEGVSSFARVHRDSYNGRCRAGCCHTGYAWAARREVLEAAGGWIEELILGGADHLMAAAIFGLDRALWTSAIPGGYPPRVEAWCRSFASAVERQIGYVDGDLHHLFHGKPVHRQYRTRHAIPPQYGYDPARHLRKNADGVNQIVDLPGLCDHVCRYFHERREDAR